MDKNERTRVYNVITQLTDGDIIVSLGAYIAMFPDAINEIDDDIKSSVLNESKKYNPDQEI